MTDKIIKWLKNKIDYFCLIAIILISLFLNLLSIGSQLTNHIALTNSLDFSWVLDLPERFLHGYISGKDFIFTYGPLYQLFSALPSLIFHVPTYIGILYGTLPLTVLVCVLIFYLTKLIVIGKIEQILLFVYLFFIVDLIVFPDPSSMLRIIVPLIYSLIYVKYASVNKKFSFSTLLILSTPAILGLYIFDFFVLCLAITIVIIIFETLNYFRHVQTRNKQLLAGLVQICLIIGFELLVSLLLSHSLQYTLLSLDMVRNYQFMENIGFTINKPYILFLYPLGLVFILFYFLKQTKNSSIKRTGIILTITAILCLKSSLIRTDEAHIILGVYPSIIVIFILLFLLIRKSGLNKLITISLISCILFIPYKENVYQMISLKYFYNAFYFIQNPPTFSSLYKFSNQYYFNTKDLEFIGSLIKNNPNNIMIYPTDILLLDIYGQTYNTLPVLFHNASNSSGEKIAVNRLNEHPPKFIILGIDSISAVALDNIPNFSRNPYLAKWMISNYSIYKNKGKYLVLIFNPDKNTQFNKSSTNTDCDIFEINVTEIMNSNIFDNIKPPTFYLQNINNPDLPQSFRLPYTGNNKSILIIEGYNNPDKIRNIFERNIDFGKYLMKEKSDFTIIEKYIYPKITKTFNYPFSVKCY